GVGHVRRLAAFAVLADQLIFFEVADVETACGVDKMTEFFILPSARSLAHVSRHAVVPILNLREPAILVVAFPNQPTRRRSLGATADRFLDFADQRETRVLKMMLLVFEFLPPRAQPGGLACAVGTDIVPRVVRVRVGSRGRDYLWYGGTRLVRRLLARLAILADALWQLSNLDS